MKNFVNDPAGPLISRITCERDEALRALKLCARVMSGGALSKLELTEALAATRDVLRKHKSLLGNEDGCAVCGREGPLVDNECPDCRH